jgi:D-alanyl-D-alanine dipeptidase
MNLANVQKSLDFVLASKDFVELTPGARWDLDIRYASANNFVGVDMYGVFNRAFLHRISAAMLSDAADRLRARHPGYRFLIYDALRPRSIQWVLWNHVVGTPGENYIGNPERGSMHNFGFAVDLTLVDQSGQPLDMGAGFDDFRELAQPQLEERFVREGLLSREHIAHRDLLREVMHGAGFTQLKHEWWHFDALPREEVRGKYAIVE